MDFRFRFPVSKHLRILSGIAAATTLAILQISPLAQEKEPIDLILVAGQSNSVGFNAIPGKLPPNPVDKEVLFWWRCGDPPPDKHDTVSRKWTHLQPQPLGDPMPKSQGTPRQYGNFAQPEGGFGPEIGLARTLMAQNGGKKLAIVKAAFSGTGIQKDWNPESDGEDGDCYRALIEETKTAIAAAKKNGQSFRLRALVWVQGESDANQNDAPKYAERLNRLIASLREDLEAPGLIALVAVNTKFGGGKNAFMPKIVEAQELAASNDPKCVYVDTSAATIANNAHYDTQGTLDVGKWMAEALMELQGN